LLSVEDRHSSPHEPRFLGDNDVPSTGDEQERRRLVERLVKIDLRGGFG